MACPSFSFCLSRFRLCRSHHPRSRTVRRPPQSGHPFPYLYPRPILEPGDGSSGGRRDQEETAMARAGAGAHRYRSDAPPFPSTSGLASTSAPSFPLLAQMATQHGEGGPFVGAGEGRQRRKEQVLSKIPDVSHTWCRFFFFCNDRLGSINDLPRSSGFSSFWLVLALQFILLDQIREQIERKSPAGWRNAPA
ncbi:hypothetical protein GQ55_4G150300 [Panicum hallii var. hallii]|uniref:Uncharacterized protein n=1 Tax=Panicum hallii var. hallii TaxID=1504633 RepID=A0A2T7DYE3_9POAL|nr:hypothetical protein GQ55_4G150300 [Panicum hallii var. hallii]